MSRRNVLIVIGVLYLTTTVLCGVADSRGEEKENKQKEIEADKKKPNILRDYVCLRDGELCHPDFGKNRGLYVSCSNGVAWEQSCPKCVYHPIACPTKSLWFDGEKCEWASPKLASQPCIDKIPLYEMNNMTAPKDIFPQQQAPAMSEQEALFQSLQSGPIQLPMPMSIVNQMKDQYAEKNKWQGNPMASPGPGHFKSPKSGQFEGFEPSQDIDLSQVEHKEGDDAEQEVDSQDSSDMDLKHTRKSAEENESEFPTYLSTDDASMGSKITRLSEPVYALVNSPNGNGKQVLMRVFQPFVLEDAGRGLLPSILAHGE